MDTQYKMNLDGKIKYIPLSPVILLLTSSYLLKFKILWIPTNLFEIIILLIFLYSTFLCIKKYNFKNYFRVVSKPPFKFSLLLIFLGFFIATITNPDMKSGLGVLKGWLIMPYLFLISFQVEKVLLNKKFELIKFFLLAIIVNTGVTAILALYLQNHQNYLLTWDGRLKFFFESPNMLAILLSVGLITSIYSVAKKIKVLKYISLFFIPFLLFGIYKTDSTGAFLGIAGSLILSFLISSKLSKKILKKITCKMNALYISFQKKSNRSLRPVRSRHVFTIIIIFCLSISFLFLFKYTQNEFYKYYYGPQSPMTSRHAIWRTSLKIISDNPVTGIQPNTFINEYWDYTDYFSQYPQWDAPHPHNIYLMFWIYGGTLGFTGFVTLISKFLSRSFSSLNKKKRRLYYLLSINIILYILIHGLVDNSLIKNDSMLFFFFFITIPFLSKKGGD